MSCTDYAIVRGTTPTITVDYDGDLTGLYIHLSFNAGSLVVKDTDDLTVTVEDEVTTITAHLTQAETLSMKAGTNCTVQLRAYNADGSIAEASSKAQIPVLDIQEDGYLPPDWSE